MDQTELLWGLLIAEQGDPVKNLDPHCIDFGRLHPESGRTLLVEAVNMVLSYKDIDENQMKTRLDCIKRLINWGASPFQTCSKPAFCFSMWKEHDRAGTKIKVETAGLSAISYVHEWLRQLKKKPEWRDRFDALGRVLACFATSVPNEKAARVSVLEEIAELWEKQLAAKASHDLTFKTADGEVTGHAQMLKDASSVISAMLASTMKEGQARTIEVKDTNSSSVSLFLERLVSILSSLLSMLWFQVSSFIAPWFPLS